MTTSPCKCHKCNGHCHERPSDEQVEKDIEHMIIVRDVIDAIDKLSDDQGDHYDDPTIGSIAKWAFLGNYLVFKGVFE
jgi:hypothetical protein